MKYLIASMTPYLITVGSFAAGFRARAAWENFTWSTATQQDINACILTGIILFIVAFVICRPRSPFGVPQKSGIDPKTGRVYWWKEWW